MTYKEVFQLAQEKGYDKSIITLSEGRASITYDFPESDIDVLLSLTLIQKWLREEHGMDIEINNQFTNASEGQLYFGVVYVGKHPSDRKITQNNPTYEQALADVIREALKLLP